MYTDKQVTVVGMGRSGMAAINLLRKQGAYVLAVDEAPLSLASSNAHDPGVMIRRGPFQESVFLSSQCVVLSPGVPPHKLPLDKLRASHIPVISEIELAASLVTAPIIAVTGTNGKSTVTTLIGEMLTEAGMVTFVGGNLGRPLCEAAVAGFDVVVSEVSSFQLEWIHRFRPHIAVFLNIAPDHLDRHPSFDTYQQAKWRIFENQTERDYAVLPVSFSKERASIRAEVYRFGAEMVVETPAPSSGVNAPNGVFLKGDALVLQKGGLQQKILSLSALPITLPHYVENAMAAAAGAAIAGAPVPVIRKVLSRFTGLPHRMQILPTIRGVTYVDDSKATNVDAVLRALQSQTRPVILIAGGVSKGGNFSPLRDVVGQKARGVVLLGEAADALADCFGDFSPMVRVSSMEEAVQTAAGWARPGDVVLLSPGCASFDMFRDYHHRGMVFQAAAQKLGQDNNVR